MSTEKKATRAEEIINWWYTRSKTDDLELETRLEIKFAKWISSEENKEAKEQALAELFEKEQGLGDEKMRKVAAEKIVSSLDLPVQLSSGTEDAVAKEISFTPYQEEKTRQWRKRWMIAAAILGPVLIASFILFNQLVDNGVEHIARVEGAPTLTLSSGKQVVLDSNNLSITEEGGVNISVDSEGFIDYSALGDSKDYSVYNTLEVPAASSHQVVLSDGTRVWLNAKSTLHYPLNFSPKERVVEASGEIYFEVKHDPKRPFHVVVNGMRVEVLGTSFNVYSYKEESYAEVTLAEGKVQVHAAGNHYTLSPGKQFHWKQEQEPVVRDVNVDDYLAWKSGMYVFKSRLLKDVVSVVQRWYDVEFVFSNPAAEKAIFTGVVYKNEDINAFINNLQETSSYKIRTEEKKIIIE